MMITTALRDPQLFGSQLADASWSAWKKAALPALFGLHLDDDALEIFRRRTGRTLAPTASFREAYFVCGRRSGKSRIAALIAVFIAAFRDHSKHLAPGERGVVSLLAADR